MKLFHVTVIRYGSEELGTQFYGIFNNELLMHKEMKAYNTWRGGKYPVYSVFECELNPTEMSKSSRPKKYTCEKPYADNEIEYIDLES
jgi:hypothetical protein